MRDRLAKIFGEASAGARQARTVVGAFASGALAQGLNFVRFAPLASTLLTLTAVLALRRVLAAQPLPAAEVDGPRPPASTSMRIVGALLAAAGTVGAIGCSMALYRNFGDDLMRVLLAGPVFLAGLGLGMDLASGHRLWPRSQLRPSRGWQVLLLILAVGLAFRFGSYGWFPPPDGFSSIEEMQRASGGSAILRGQRPWEFPLAQYLAAASFALFGRSIAALRLPVTALAWLTVSLFYLLARRLVGVNAALFATALLAVSRWHCQVGWYAEDVYVPLFPFVLLLYLLLRTRREARPSLYVAAGALCGYMLYDYAAYRAAPFVAAGFFAADALWQRRWPSDWRCILLLFAVLGLFVPPLLGRLAGGRGESFYFEALQRSFAEQQYYTADPLRFVEQRLARIQEASDIFTSSDHLEIFAPLNLPLAPLLDPFTGLAFALGLGTTLLLLRRRHHLFFGWGFLVLATGAMIVPWNLDFRRLAILIPFVFLLPAFLAQQIEELAEREGWSRAWKGALVLTALAAAVYNAVFLFVWLAPDHEVRSSHRSPYSVASDYLQHHYDREYVLLLSRYTPNFFEANDYDWLKPANLYGRVAGGVEDVLSPDPPAPWQRNLLIMVLRPYDIHTVLRQISDVYEGSTCEFRPDPDHWRHDLGVCHVPRRDRLRRM